MITYSTLHLQFKFLPIKSNKSKYLKSIKKKLYIFLFSWQKRKLWSFVHPICKLEKIALKKHRTEVYVVESHLEWWRSFFSIIPRRNFSTKEWGNTGRFHSTSKTIYELLRPLITTVFENRPKSLIPITLKIKRNETFLLFFQQLCCDSPD